MKNSKVVIFLRRLYRFINKKVNLQKNGLLLYRSFFNETKSIFIHIPKAAGTSVSHALYNKDPGHYPLRKYEHADEVKFREYFKFSVVRDPVTRIISTYYYIKKRDSIKFDKHHPFYFISKYDTLNDFVQGGLTESLVREHYFFWSQSYYLSDKNGNIAVDYFAKMENLDEDFNYILKKINIDKELRKRNAGNNKENKEILTPKSIEVIYNLYKDDYVNFKFEKPKCL
ncbi:sulfotransferase family 2 domain-containing protein [Vibrio sp. SCSIO 43135]|uniref:sulfotransferase family 2 domain-containing protein n=1 Tax=Vibrio sp. SCSIO 43135 TaxID=2819096 RepID=UPI0020757CC5|nr:sulfotransferase family 2 domain-containing protein [Vibrio sp. SCSIO 43135]USD41282.1 sulfotransferase family 2 domain-containing protein [Vibrio sp. SCSIO 43135]